MRLDCFDESQGFVADTESNVDFSVFLSAWYRLKAEGSRENGINFKIFCAFSLQSETKKPIPWNYIHCTINWNLQPCPLFWVSEALSKKINFCFADVEILLFVTGTTDKERREVLILCWLLRIVFSFETCLLFRTSEKCSLFSGFEMRRNFATSQDITILSLPHQTKVGAKLQSYTRTASSQSLGGIYFMIFHDGNSSRRISLSLWLALMEQRKYYLGSHLRHLL